MKIQQFKRKFLDTEIEPLKGKYLKEDSYDDLITEDCDGYDVYGQLLFKFRKNVIPFELLKLGYDSFKKSIVLNEGRGLASGGIFKRINKDGKAGNVNVSNRVLSGNAGYMDAGNKYPFCRKTNFAKNYFNQFTAGVPFVQKVNELYRDLCPDHFKRQNNIARGTNKNYVIADTAFTTVTVNKNFQTSVHKDVGDYQQGFGNLCVYREGSYDGAYFVLPEYRIAIDLHNCDMLFIDVHKWHGNTPFVNMSDDYLRVAFVMYYREQMIKCKQPSMELHDLKMRETGFITW